ncbi:MAG: UTP--glucose-1-phosphate uridylyltransferase, partial [Gammaproteobacteria bacterium]
LTPRIFDLIGARAEAAQGEIQLTDAIASLIELETVLAYPFIGKRYDCGSKLGYLQATVEYALRHPELGRPFKSYLDEHHTDDDAAAARKTRS